MRSGILMARGSDRLFRLRYGTLRALSVSFIIGERARECQMLRLKKPVFRISFVHAAAGLRKHKHTPNACVRGVAVK